jgi:beta-lactamase class A
VNSRAPLRGLNFTSLIFACCAAATTTIAQDPPAAPSVSPARSQVEQIIQQSRADVSVAFRSLDGSQELFIKAESPFPAAPAVIQIPVMIELYAQAQAGSVRLTDTIVVHNNFRSLADGAPFQLDPKTDPDRDLYQQIGKPVSLRDLCEDMVAHNSSLAADLLIEKLGIDNIRQRLSALHISGLDFARAIEPTAPDSKGPENASSARAVLELLYSLAKRQDSGDDAGKEMIGLLARAALSQPPSAGMPSDPRNQQSVQLAGVGQQSMIVYGPHPYVVVVLTRGITNSAVSAALMAQIEHALASGLAAAVGSS